jgi:hypothetical protein
MRRLDLTKLAAAAVALAAITAPQQASAFCRTSVCPNTGTSAVCILV